MTRIQQDFSLFLEVLPSAMRERLETGPELGSLVEAVLDYGRPAEARYYGGVSRFADLVVTERDIEFVIKSIGEFGSDNRAGIERTLHRISCIRNRQGKIIGLTCRVGRALEGTIDIIDDIMRSGKSILLLGKPGTGKTTKLREVARVLADEVQKRVVIVDTSNEIAGDGDVPHPGIGAARRMQVRHASEQHQVMIEAVENHMPEVIVIDEIGNEMEALAARTIAERGVQLIGTAHGQTLENLMLNPTLADLIGGIQAVTLSDDEARRRGTQKTVLERKAPPTFDVVIELVDFERLAVHHNVQKTVDLILRGLTPRPEIRVRNEEGRFEVVQEELNEPMPPMFARPLFESGSGKGARPVTPNTPVREPVRDDEPRPYAPDEGDGDATSVRIYPYGIARTRLERAIREKRANATITGDIGSADVVLAMRTGLQTKPRKLRDLAGRPIPTVSVKSNAFTQILTGLDEILRRSNETGDSESTAMEEVLAAIEIVAQSGKAYDLSPQPFSIRKMQSEVVSARRMASESVGQEPNRRLRLLPTRVA
ncbi:MAG: AAA family ATPase [Fimbriimonadaceae bacterium]|nr:AAA family ATPase [Fimbriimonadaceae bacterium]